jgi:hypothetical protein
MLVMLVRREETFDRMIASSANRLCWSEWVVLAGSWIETPLQAVEFVTEDGCERKLNAFAMEASTQDRSMEAGVDSSNTGQNIPAGQ